MATASRYNGSVLLCMVCEAFIMEHAYYADKVIELKQVRAQETDEVRALTVTSLS